MKNGQDFLNHMKSEFQRVDAKYDPNVLDQMLGALRMKPKCDVCDQWAKVYPQCPKCKRIYKEAR